MGLLDWSSNFIGFHLFLFALFLLNFSYNFQELFFPFLSLLLVSCVLPQFSTSGAFLSSVSTLDLVVLWDRVALCSPGWPWTCHPPAPIVCFSWVAWAVFFLCTLFSPGSASFLALLLSLSCSISSHSWRLCGRVRDGNTDYRFSVKLLSIDLPGW